MSAQVFAFEYSSYLGLKKGIARIPGAYVQALFDDAAAHEFRVLTALHEAGLPCPKPLALGDKFLLLEYLEGESTGAPTDSAGFVIQIAQALANIHNTSLESGALDFLPRNKSTWIPRVNLNIDLREPEVVTALEAFGPPPLEAAVLRHGDFWPGNILWQGNDLTGIIDWENALLGPALADVAISRLDIYWVLGRNAMHQFTSEYLRLRPASTKNLPYWDLRAALRPMANLPDWVAPYKAIHRPDITLEHLQAVLLEFIDDCLPRFRGHHSDC